MDNGGVSAICAYNHIQSPQHTGYGKSKKNKDGSVCEINRTELVEDYMG